MGDEAVALQIECESYALRNSPDGRRNAMARALRAAYEAGFSTGRSVRQKAYDDLHAQVQSLIADNERYQTTILALRTLWRTTDLPSRVQKAIEQTSKGQSSEALEWVQATTVYALLRIIPREQMLALLDGGDDAV